MASFLITGASRGFGLALTRELVSRPASEVGHHYCHGARRLPDLNKIAKRPSGRVVVVKLDVTDDASVKKAAAEVEAKLGAKGLDVLINNAGVCQYAPDSTNSM
ncbi:putative short chain oxidoreductase [Colletotrichum sublineola]|uniref:Putative short chain oxidoreductase n=1 Tax=Colletotrichum sublineola TaxID=1173701 RepID=A0A066XNP0_COLSU|nr:putative short chain oxidoreductase [Colletotrichum sublineola]